MFPVLIRIGDFPIHTYGVMIAIGFLLCVWVARREAVRLGLPTTPIVDLAFWSLLMGVLGSRLLFVFTQWPYFMEHPREIFSIWEGGLVFYGGPLFCIPFFLWFTERHNLPVWEVLDIGAPSIVLAHAFGRLGCFSAGCCYGKPTDLPWGVKFHSLLVDAPLRGIPLHPTQLYESACLFLLFFFLRYRRKHKKFPGELALIYAIAYSIIRSVIEVFRGDTVRGFVIPDILSTSQFISIFVVTGAVLLYIWRKRTERKRMLR